MGRIDLESGRLFCPDFADILVGCEAPQNLEAAGEVVSVDEIAEVAAKLEGSGGSDFIQTLSAWRPETGILFGRHSPSVEERAGAR